jgi:hypothetical protein
MNTLSAVELQAVREQIIRTNEQLRGKVEQVSRVEELIEQLREKMDKYDEAVALFGLRVRVRS